MGCNCGKKSIQPSVSRPLLTPDAKHSALYQQVVTQRSYRYERVGLDDREIEFLGNGTIGKGRAGMEIVWTVKDGELHVGTSSATTFTATVEATGVLQGRWLSHEKCVVVLTPISTLKSS